jgi:hypothetical protein
MGEISDEFKVTVVEAIRTLCLKFPSKQAGMLAFLSGILRDEGYVSLMLLSLRVTYVNDFDTEVLCSSKPLLNQ